MRIHNFSAGPAAIPTDVLLQAQAELLDWRGVGASVMEISHRDKKFIDIAEAAERDLRELMAIPANYKVLFLQGGATTQFAQIPMNLAAPEQTADYIVTGAWGQKAVKEAAGLVHVNVAADAGSYTAIPDVSSWKLSKDAAYVHITPNETIHGVEMHSCFNGKSVPNLDAPIVADMSSNILSRQINVQDYGLIYAGAQKNIGPSGILVMIVRDDLLARQPRKMPAILNYAKHAENGSMLNTPPTFAWYIAGLVFQWIKKQGGVAEIERRNAAKAASLYSYIDGSGFYRNEVAPAARSHMNVPFFLGNSELDGAFVKGADALGLMGLKGHRDVGGMRASIYNAVSQESVDALISYMKDFAAKA
jgi:phosphoserine aminotransferase